MNRPRSLRGFPVLLGTLAFGACTIADSPAPTTTSVRLGGVGLVAGLQNTGASDPESRQAILRHLQNSGLSLTVEDIVSSSIARVSLTCDLPAHANVDDVVQVRCQVLGNATSLRGGELLRSTLDGTDGQTYVVAGGAVVTRGDSGSAGTLDGWVQNGVVVRAPRSTR